MIGIILATVSGIAAAVSGIKCFAENQAAKERGRERIEQNNNYARTYYDRKGNRRLLATDEHCDIRRDEHGDEILYVGAPSHPTRNLSKEKRELQWFNTQNSNHNGRTVEIYDERLWSRKACTLHKELIQGTYYKDFETGKIYVCRMFSIMTGDFKVHHCKFYMDIKTGMLVRMADTQKLLPPEHGHYVDEATAQQFINNFNQKQSEGGYDIRLYSKSPIEKKQDFYCNHHECNDWVYTLEEEKLMSTI